MDAPVGSNPLDNVEPHRFLQPEVRAALWAACQKVLAQPGDFAEALAWLHEGYSEAALSQRELAKVDRLYRENLRQLRRGRDLCDTFPRRKALRHGTPREALVAATLQTARLRGWRIHGGEVIQDPQADAANLITADQVEVVWRWLDERCRQEIQWIKDRRAERRAACRKRVEDRGWRLQQAIEDALEMGLPAGQDEGLYARRVVLLACLLSWPHELPLAGEFASWPWNKEGHYPPLIGERFVPGRQTALFCPAHPTDETLAPTALNLLNLRPFADLVARAVQVLAAGTIPTVTPAILNRPDEREVPGSDIPGKGKPWHVAMKVAEAHCARNTFPGVRTLARLAGCSSSTMSKAIDSSDMLRTMLVEQKAQRKRVSAANLSEGTLASLRQTREPDPAEEASRNTDNIFSQLLDQATPAERAKMNAMSRDERQALVAAAHDPEEAEQERRYRKAHKRSRKLFANVRAPKK